MVILEHGALHEKKLLFLPCTGVPAWAFTEAAQGLAKQWHVFQVIFDGHQPECPGEFISVEDTVEKITAYFRRRGIYRLDAAYGCGLGGACLTRLLALGELPVNRAILDGGTTPRRSGLAQKLRLERDVLGFRMLTRSRSSLESLLPPERYTLPGHDPAKEYAALERNLKTYSPGTIRNICRSAYGYALPDSPVITGVKIVYWYGDAEKKAREQDIRFVKAYFPQVRVRGIRKMAHGELVMAHPEEFCHYARKFLNPGEEPCL